MRTIVILCAFCCLGVAAPALARGGCGGGGGHGGGHGGSHGGGHGGARASSSVSAVHGPMSSNVPYAPVSDGRTGGIRLNSDGGSTASGPRFGLGATIYSGDFALATDWVRYAAHDGGASWWLGGVWYLFGWSPVAMLRLSGGPGLLIASGDDGGVGGGLRLGLDLLPVKPLVVSVHGEIGKPCEQSVARLRATVGVLLDRWEFYAGLDHAWLPSGADGGPTVGVRLWL